MKRLFSTCLALLCLMAVVSSAQGAVLRTQGIGFPSRHQRHYAPTVQAYPGLSFDTDSTWHARTDQLAQALKDASPPYDLFMLGGHIDGQRVMAAGLCADLSGSAVIRQAIGRMWPQVRAAVTHEGHIYAVPDGLLLSAFGWHEAAWQAAGLQGVKPPQCYTELLDFLAHWIAHIQAKPLPNIRVNGMFDDGLYNQNAYVDYLLPLLMDCYALPSLQAGEKPDFRAPEFAQLLDRTVSIGQALYLAEPPPGEGKLSLFCNESLSFGLLGIQDGYAHAMPLRVHMDQPPLYKAQISLLCVGADSARQVLATGYLEQAITHMDAYAATYAYMDSPPLERENLPQDIANQQARVENTQAQLSAGKLSETKKRELETQLSRQSQVLASMQTEAWRYLLSPQWLAEYRAAAPHMVFPAPGPYNLASPEGAKALQLARDFAQQKISAEQFVEGLMGLQE